MMKLTIKYGLAALLFLSLTSHANRFDGSEKASNISAKTLPDTIKVYDPPDASTFLSIVMPAYKGVPLLSDAPWRQSFYSNELFNDIGVNTKDILRDPSFFFMLKQISTHAGQFDKKLYIETTLDGNSYRSTDQEILQQISFNHSYINVVMSFIQKAMRKEACKPYISESTLAMSATLFSCASIFNFNKHQGDIVEFERKLNAFFDTEFPKLVNWGNNIGNNFQFYTVARHQRLNYETAQSGFVFDLQGIVQIDTGGIQFSDPIAPAITRDPHGRLKHLVQANEPQAKALLDATEYQGVLLVTKYKTSLIPEPSKQYNKYVIFGAPIFNAEVASNNIEILYYRIPDGETPKDRRSAIYFYKEKTENYNPKYLSKAFDIPTGI